MVIYNYYRFLSVGLRGVTKGDYMLRMSFVGKKKK